jgi:hypothetical protein
LVEVKYPNVVVRLDGSNIEGQVGRALRAAGVPEAEITQFQQEHRAEGDDKVRNVVLRWVALDPKPKFQFGDIVYIRPGADLL